MTADDRNPGLDGGPEDQRSDTDSPGGEDESRDAGAPPPATWAGRARAGAGGDDAPESGEDSEGTGETDPAEEQPALPDQAGPAEEQPVPPDGDQQTVETDALALGEREAAEEAALAGLRARAERRAAGGGRAGGGAAAAGTQGDDDRGDGAPASGGDTDEGDGPEAGDDAAGDPTSVIPATVAEPIAAGAPGSLPGPDSAGEPPRRKALWARFLAAALLIVVSTATATTVSLLLVLTDLAEGIGGIPDIEQELTPVGGGDPQTLLILGSDERLGHEGGDEGGARSDTAILLRVDPQRGSIGLLSIPRDLRVNIPGVGVDRFNAAYAHGGPKLTLRTVKRLTGLEINHVVNINFTGFADAVNAIDCVFVDVDRRYYVPEGSEYAAIDPPIEAGYQRLCGLKALQYVRFRHDDNDLVRAARQQDFLREARQKIPPSTLFSQRYELLDIFKEYTTSDEALSDPIQLLELLKTFLAARKAPVNEIHFPAQLGGPNDPYVTANQGQIKRTVRQFLGTAGTPGPKPGSAGDGEGDGGRGGGQRGGGREEGGRDQRGGGGGSGPAMVEAPITRDVAQQIADATTPSGKRLVLDFPVEYPTEVPVRTNLNPIEASRAFPIDGPADEVYEGYKMVFGIPGSAGFTEYWGISGTSWRDPPILENPSEERRIGGREYLLFYDGDRLRLVGWKKRRTAYWVNNTLLQSLSEGEMLAIARSMRRLDG